MTLHIWVFAFFYVILCSFINKIVLDSMNAVESLVKESFVCSLSGMKANSIFNSKRALHTNMPKNKNPQCGSEGSTWAYHIPGICQIYAYMLVYARSIPSICLVYAWYIPEICLHLQVGIFLVYTWYMPSILPLA
jgi:hypothetical protein